MPPVRVVSEIGPLETVLVHTPGRELLAVTPGTREEYLYDDIIELETARAEHAVLVRVLERFATVHQEVRKHRGTAIRPLAQGHRCPVRIAQHLVAMVRKGSPRPISPGAARGRADEQKMLGQ